MQSPVISGGSGMVNAETEKNQNAGRALNRRGSERSRYNVTSSMAFSAPTPCSPLESAELVRFPLGRVPLSSSADSPWLLKLIELRLPDPEAIWLLVNALRFATRRMMRYGEITCVEP